ncbi:conserved hypothetical protein [Candidatus Terasakiella magnetica]|nr:conserved hypothetical protein [Candidatus Terasakiella magnetica]
MEASVHKPATPEDQEALFQMLLRKLPSLTEVKQLEEAALVALALMLRRPTDRELRDELTLEIKAITEAIKPGQSPAALKNEIRFAARNVIKVLQAAKERRLPRHVTDNWAQSQAKPAHAVHAHPPKAGPNRQRLIIGLLLAATAVFGGWAWWSNSRSDEASGGSEAKRFAEQIFAAAQGNAPATHMFGGRLRVAMVGDRLAVIAEGVPPKICSASGWSLSHKGILTINGITPVRISSGKVTELCNSEEGDAAIMWMPK